MNFQATSAVCGESRITLRLEMACELAAVRTATLAVRDWLAEKGLPEMELGGWELALAEAANNAVKYADARIGSNPKVTSAVLVKAVNLVGREPVINSIRVREVLLC